MKKIWEYLKQKNHLLIAIIAAVVIVLLAIVYIQHNRIANLKDKYQTEVNLKNALLDSTHYYQNKRNEWVAEKLTLQESIKNLDKMNGQLTAFQKELLARVKEIEKNNKIIAAALIQTNVKIDSLRNGNVSVDTLNKNVTFSDSTKNIQYKIRVNNVYPALANVKPTLSFQEFTLPNKQFIEFHWKNDKKSGYPIAFSVSNSNDYFQTVNIDSYAIPELKKDDIKPTFWKKVGTFFTKTGGKIVYAGAGAATMWLIMK